MDLTPRPPSLPGKGETPADLYAASHPEPADVLLAVEVADTSVDYDREVKLRQYAGAGVMETWLVNLPADCIESHRRPTAGGYAEVQRLERGQHLGPLALPHLEIAVDEILGSAAQGQE